MTITCPTAASVGAASSFSGALAGAPGEALVAVVYERPDGTLVTHTLSSGSGGSFSDSFTPDQSGTWHALANYGGDANHTASADVCQFAATGISLRCAVNPGQTSISCSGQLTSGGGGVPRAPIELTYRPPAGAAVMHNKATAADGTYSDAYNALPGSTLASGTWQITADYAGDAAHAPASASQSLTIS
jgi:hypothetical protein